MLRPCLVSFSFWLRRPASDPIPDEFREKKKQTSSSILLEVSVKKDIPSRSALGLYGYCVYLDKSEVMDLTVLFCIAARMVSMGGPFEDL